MAELTDQDAQALSAGALHTKAGIPREQGHRAGL